MSLKPDYSNYTIAELQESLAVVDGRKYPENKAALEAELAARKASGEYEREAAAAEESRKEKEAARTAFAKKARVFTAWYLVVSPIVVLSMFNYRQLPQMSGLQLLLVALIVAYLAMSHWAGIGLLRDRPWAERLAIGTLILQVVRFSSDVFYLQVLPLAGIFVSLGEYIVLDIRFRWEPSVQVSWGVDRPLQLGVNLVAIAMIYYLVRSRIESD